jgi:dephospho-CoA kinase
MRRRAFADPAARRQLEAILHPLIRARATAEIAALRAPYVLLAIPLLAETGRAAYGLDRVLLVDCPEAVQHQRVMARSGLTADEVAAIMATQASRAARRAIADDVLDNSGTPAELEAAVADLHRRYLACAAAQDSG